MKLLFIDIMTLTHRSQQKNNFALGTLKIMTIKVAMKLASDQMKLN